VKFVGRWEKKKGGATVDGKKGAAVDLKVHKDNGLYCPVKKNLERKE